MPIFEMQTPDGRSFQVDAPDMQTAASSLDSLPPADTSGRSSAVSALRGIPILGAYTDKAAAALNAAAQPFVGAPGMSEAPSFGERYAENLPKITAAGNQFEQQHPIGSTALQIGAGAAALGPIGATATGARLLGLGGTTLAGLATRGALSGAALGGADTAARGGDIGTGAALGAGVGAAFPVVGRVIGRALSPGAGVQSAERQAAVNTLQAEGVDALTAGQRTGSKAIQYTENELGGRKNQAMQEKALEQYTAAALKKAGGLPGETRSTPTTLSDIYDRIGNRFKLNQNQDIPLDKRFFTDAQRVASDFQGLTGRDPSLFDPFAKNSLFQRVAVAAPTGPQINGAGYQSIRSDIGRMARQSSQPEVRNALYEFQHVLDDAIERGLKNPADAKGWQEARRLYRNFLVVERASGKAGETGAAGFITPAALRTAAEAIDKRGFKLGRSDFTDLARAGNQVMGSLPQSGTAPRAAARAIPAMMVGAAAHGLAGIPGIAAAAMAPAITGRLAMSRPGQAYLRNQLALRLPGTGILSRASLPAINERSR